MAPERRALVYRFLVERLRLVFRDDLREGTLPPFLRVSLRAIAIACLRLFTFRPDPLLRVPAFFRRIADRTFFDAALPYFAIVDLHETACKRCAEGSLARLL
jgi:hypothetical protein